MPSNTVGSRTPTSDGFGYPLGLGMGVPASDVAPSQPAVYRSTEVGVVRLGTGNYEALVEQLRALLDD
jgi:hypothetical protein